MECDVLDRFHFNVCGAANALLDELERISVHKEPGSVHPRRTGDLCGFQPRPEPADTLVLSIVASRN